MMVKCLLNWKQLDLGRVVLFQQCRIILIINSAHIYYSPSLLSYVPCYSMVIPRSAGVAKECCDFQWNESDTFNNRVTPLPSKTLCRPRLVSPCPLCSLAHH